MPKLHSVKTDYAKNYTQLKQTMPKLHTAKTDYARMTHS